MSLNPGDQICYRLMPEIFRYVATVLSDDEQTLALQLAQDAPPRVAGGQYLMLTEPEGDVEHYTEVTGWDEQSRQVRLRRLWTGKRGYFRVDDVFPVIHRLVSGEGLRPESKLFSGYGFELEDLDVPDETVNPRLWKMLVDMNAKLAMILERLNLEHEGLTRAESVPVNISASGIRFALPQRAELGGVMELKMLLPVYPPVGILAHGTVVRVEDMGNGTFRTSLQFIDLADEVRDIIIQYTLKRQRELIRRQREAGQTE